MKSDPYYVLLEKSLKEMIKVNKEYLIATKATLDSVNDLMHRDRAGHAAHFQATIDGFATVIQGIESSNKVTQLLVKLAMVSVVIAGLSFGVKETGIDSLLKGLI
jgi:hypothetical protein